MLSVSDIGATAPISALICALIFVSIRGQTTDENRLDFSAWESAEEVRARSVLLSSADGQTRAMGQVWRPMLSTPWRTCTSVKLLNTALQKRSRRAFTLLNTRTHHMRTSRMDCKASIGTDR
jgi:hypothetical protein